MVELDATLFPEASLSKKDLKRILSFFGSLTVCVPWEMDPPTVFEAAENLVRVLRPPGHLKPSHSFRSLLREYKAWMNSHRDTGYALFLQAQRDAQTGAEATWEIRQAIRREGPEIGVLNTEQATRWHLILHLAKETWEAQKEGEEALHRLRTRGSPLATALGESEFEDPLQDLPGFEAGPEMDERFLEPVIEAWSGLFGTTLDAGALLVTTKPGVFTCLSDLWAEYFTEKGSHDLKLRFTWPHHADQDEEAFAEETGRMPDQRHREFREQVAWAREDPVGRFERLAEGASRLDRGETMAPGERELHFSMKTFAPPPKGNVRRKKALLNALSGRTLFYVAGAFHRD